jgi:uncharacterized protein YegP (UPF0339 family)
MALTYPCYWEYKDTRGEWRWTYYAKNAEAIAVSSEGYVRYEDCHHAVYIMKASANSEVYKQST